MALPVALYSVAQVRDIDARAIAAGTPGYTLMKRAGEGALRVLRSRWPTALRIAVVCGGGNNGGDGYVLARFAQAAGLTALFMGLMGSAGYLTSRDLSALGRVSFVGLIILLVFGIVAIFVNIPGENLIWCIGGLVVFAGLTMFDFWRLRRAGNGDVAQIALSIFLDAFNVFLLMLRLLGGGRN